VFTNIYLLINKVYGEEFGIVPYIMPGFDLAKLANDVYKSNPKVKGLLLLKHGLFTFGETAKESYLNHINAIKKAEEYINTKPLKSLTKSMDTELSGEDREQLCGQLLPRLRGIFFRESNGISWIFSLYDTPAAVEFATSREVDAWSQRGPLTPGIHQLIHCSNCAHEENRSRHQNKGSSVVVAGSA
jgi:rhamnose utilization protein RhaD (predicted bifunctional aldolase and dehydrogenase)